MLEIPLLTSIVLFAIGIGGVLTKRDLLRIVISVSIILGSITLLLVALATANPAAATAHYSFVLFIWAVEVMEIIIALAAFLYLSRNNKTDVNELRQWKW